MAAEILESVDDSMVISFVGLAFLAFLYFLPTVVAGFRKHRNVGAIFALNLLLGWTVLGWIAAMVWSATSDPAPIIRIDRS